MNPFGFQNPGLAWLALTIIPLVALYFLKLKRPRVQIPSLVLWQQVMQDQRVNSPFQRFRKNRLLLLQLLALILFILAAMMPFLKGDSPEQRGHVVWLVDVSASMAATGDDGKEVVLDRVKTELLNRVDGIGAQQIRSLIAFDNSARELASLTGNARQLKQIIKELEVHDLPSDPVPALRMAEALSKRAPVERVVIFTDGNLHPRISFNVPFKLEMENLSHDTAMNAGITALAAQRNANDEWDLLARIEHNLQTPTTIRARWTPSYDGLDAAVSLEPGRDAQLRATVPGTGGIVRLELLPFSRDDLRSDNTAAITLSELRPLRVSVDTNLQSFVKALKGVPGIMLNQGETPDLSILRTAGKAPVSLSVGSIPPALSNAVFTAQEPDEIVDWQRDHRLMRYVNLDEINLYGSTRFAPDHDESDLERLGFRGLIHGQHGPLLLEEHHDDRKQYHLCFNPEQSTLTYRVAFPVFVANLLEECRAISGFSQIEARKTGRLPKIQLETAGSYMLQGPRGHDQSGITGEDGSLSGLSALHVGQYDLQANNATTHRWQASLLNASETRLTSHENLVFNEVQVQQQESALRQPRPLWRWLAGLAFLILLAEWRVAHRTPRGHVLKSQEPG